MRKKTLALIAVLLTVTAVALAKFVIVRQDGTLVVIDDEQLTFVQQGETFTVNGMDVSQVGHIYNKEWNRFGDYERAFTQGYLSTDYLAKPRQQQITSQEFKALLKPLIEQFQPDSMAYFNAQITDYDMPMKRNMAVGMAYYTARCIGAETRNKQFTRDDIADFWNGNGDQDLPLVLPASFDSGDADAPEALWWRGFGGIMTAYMWNNEHKSFKSGAEVIGFDAEQYTYHWEEAFTWSDAISAVTRLHDSLEQEIVYASMDDPRVTSPDATVITPELMARAAQNEIHDIADMPRIVGLAMGEGNTDLACDWQFGFAGKDIREVAEWGFNSVKYGISWRHLFDSNLRANLSVFQSLDELIAAAMEHNIHLSLTMCAIPGCGSYQADDIHDDYVMDTDILNTEKRQKACDIWRTIATRYKDVPNRNLSFVPITEYQVLYAPDGFGTGEAFSAEQIFDYIDMLVDAIREVSPERFIYYDVLTFNLPSADNDMTPIAQEQCRHMAEKYPNTRPNFNHMDMAYMFYEYNQGDGNIDYAHHSVWVPTYPITLYSGNSLLLAGGNDQLTIDGCLPSGTVLNFYLSSVTDATLTVAADGTALYEESFEGQHDFNVGYAMAYGEPFRASDKLISVPLSGDAQEVTLSVSRGGLNWCGIEVVLPEDYAVERWRKDSEWDLELGLIAPEDFHRGEFYKKATRTVQIGTTLTDWQGSQGFHFTIGSDVTFTSDYVYAASDKEQTETMVREVTEAFPGWTCRMEDILVTDNDGALRYWDDTMEVFQQYGVDVWTSAIGLLTEENLAHYRIAGYEGEPYKGHHNFNLQLLRVLQKYQD